MLAGYARPRRDFAIYFSVSSRYHKPTIAEHRTNKTGKITGSRTGRQFQGYALPLSPSQQ
jgi:hypothetical protein